MTEEQTNHVNNQWDLLAQRFNTHMAYEQVHPDVAVNIHVGWSIIMHQIDSYLKSVGREYARVFDFGCGAGEFCKALHKQGHKVIGLDKSRGMVELAKKHLPKGVPIVHGDHKSKLFNQTSYIEKYDIAVAIHSLEWIEDVGVALKNLSKILKKGGTLIFAVFPKSHIIDSLRIKDLFEDFDSKKDPYAGYANFDGIRVPVFIRDASYFDNVLTKLKFDKVLEYYPPYPKYFLESYKWQGSLCPEMMVLVYKKR